MQKVLGTVAAMLLCTDTTNSAKDDLWSPLSIAHSLSGPRVAMGTTLTGNNTLGTPQEIKYQGWHRSVPQMVKTHHSCSAALSKTGSEKS